MKLHGRGAVPVWFVKWPELRDAVADGVLTITELDALPSHITGLASFSTQKPCTLPGAPRCRNSPW